MKSRPTDYRLNQGTLRIRVFACLALAVCIPPASAQLLSRTILHPDRLAGPWQASDDAGGTVGLALEIQTTVPGRPASLDRQTQNLQSFFITLYRTGSQPGAHAQRNVYSLKSTFWDGRHLRLHSAPPGRPEQISTCSGIRLPRPSPVVSSMLASISRSR